MATRPLDILGWPTGPDGTGDVFPEPYNIKATNDAFRDHVYVFNDTGTRLELGGRFRVPDDYVGAPKILVPWTAIITSGDVELDFDYRAIGGDDAESMDQAGTQESVNVLDTAPTAINNLLVATLTLAAGNFAAGDWVRFGFFRDGADAGDTMAAAMILFGLYFDYSDA